MKLLYYSPASYGGLADYAHEQATALENLGIEVTLLCTPNYLETRNPQYKCVPILRETSLSDASSKLNKFFKAIYFVRSTLGNFATLAQFVQKQGFGAVLLGSYVEYLAPLWAGSLRRLARKGVVFGAIVHDPVRDFVLGPLWWHRLSIAAGYSFLQIAFVHEAINLETVKSFPRLKTIVIPQGLYAQAAPTESISTTRERLHLPIEAKVMLAFGHIRTNKNLDLVIRAMAQVPDVYLVVAGKELQASQNLTLRYQQLAKEWGVDQHCRWEIGFVPAAVVTNLFNAADLILLTYSKAFRSASAVLNTAAVYRKPCLVSAGVSALKSVTQQYQLGLWVEPDSVEAIAQALKNWEGDSLLPNWPAFLADNSWVKNAQIVSKSLGS